MDEKLLEKLEEVSKSQEEIMTRQKEMLKFFQSEAEKSRVIREEAIALQKKAMDRVKTITYLAVPAILVCIFLIIYLTAKYDIF